MRDLRRASKLRLAAGWVVGVFLVIRCGAVNAEMDDPAVVAIIEELSASGSMDKGGEGVVRHLVSKELDPADELYVQLGLKLYDRGYDEASAAVFAAHHLQKRRSMIDQEVAVPVVVQSAAWRPTHRVRLTNGQLMKGVPLDADAGGFWLETEPGSRIRLEASEIIATEPLDGESGS